MPRRSYARHKFEKPAIPAEADDEDHLGDFGEIMHRRKADEKGSDELLRLLIKHHGDDQ